MADEIPPAADGEKKAEPAAENLPARTDAAPPANVPAGESAAELAEKHGGRPTGRARADGLTPGTPEAIQADRDRDAKRKREQRALRNKIYPSGKSPAPIPSALPVADAAVPVAGSPDDLLDAANRARLLWTGTKLEPICADLVSALEEFRDYMRERKLRLAQLPPEVAAELTKDSAWGERRKKILCESGAQVIARLLNKTKLSAEHQDEIIFLSALLMTGMDEFRFHSKLNLVIAENKKNPQSKAA